VAEAERDARTIGLLKHVARMAPDAIALLAMSKDEAIAAVRTHRDTDPQAWLRAFARAVEDAKTLASLIESAWGRLAVAIAAAGIKGDGRAA
jgi:hypothetical protein